MAKAAASKQQIFAVLGTDESEVKRVAKELSSRLMPEGAGDFGAEIIDGVAENSDGAAQRIHQTIESLLTMPFFGGSKLVWLKNANFLGDSVMGRSAAVQEALEKLLTVLTEQMSDEVRFLLSATEIDKRRSFYKTISKIGKVEVYDKLDTSKSGWEEAAASEVTRRADLRGLRFTPEAIELFIHLAGADSRQIDNELEKLDLFLGKERTVGEETVRLMVAQTKSGVIFELGNAIARRDLKKALALADQLLFQGEQIVGILLVAVIPTVRNLLITKELMTRHRIKPPSAPYMFTGILNRLPESATRHLPKKKDGTVNAYALGLAAVEVHRYRIEELVEALEACLEANLQVVTSQLDPRMVLSQLIVKITT